MELYTLLHFKWITNKDPLCSTGKSVTWQPGWEGSVGENRYF